MDQHPPITRSRLNAWLWQRQGFERTRPWDNTAALAADVGHYGTGPTLFPALLARYESLAFPAVESALYVERSLVRLRVMRYSLFALPRRAVVPTFQATWRAAVSTLQTALRRSGVTPAEYDEVAQRVCAALAAGPLTVAEIKQEIGPLASAVERAFGQIRSMLCAEGCIVRGPVRSGWKSDTCAYALMAHWLPDTDLASLTQDEAAAALALEYFDAFGPATVEDLRWWSGLKATEIARAVETIRPRLVAISVEGLPDAHLLPADRLPALLAAPDRADGVRLLPVWDTYTMAYRRRTRYLTPDQHDRIFDAVGNATSALLVDGEIAGVWDWWQQGKRLTVAAAPFTPLPALALDAFEAEAHRFAAAAAPAGCTVETIVTGAPATLLGGSQNLFKAPLPHLRA